MPGGASLPGLPYLARVNETSAGNKSAQSAMQ